MHPPSLGLRPTTLVSAVDLEVAQQLNQLIRQAIPVQTSSNFAAKQAQAPLRHDAAAPLHPDPFSLSGHAVAATPADRSPEAFPVLSEEPCSWAVWRPATPHAGDVSAGPPPAGQGVSASGARLPRACAGGVG